MKNSTCRAACGGAAFGVALLLSGLPAAATSVADNYYGGVDAGSYGDVIGDAYFNITSADISRAGNKLTVKVYTDFVNHISTTFAGSGGPFQIGLGHLFIGNASDLNRSGSMPYSNDTFTADPGRFKYAVSAPFNPGVTTSGASTVYALNQTGSDVVTANVDGSSQTYPNNPSSWYYFREGQAVSVNNTAATTTQGGVTANWSIDHAGGLDNNGASITFEVDNFFNNLVGDSPTLVIAWAMTCANDVFLETYAFPPGGPGTTTPLPAAFPMFAGGLGILGFLGHKRRKKQQAKVAA